MTTERSWKNNLWRKPNYSKETYISATSHTKNPRWTHLRLNLGLSDEVDWVIRATVLTKY